MGQWASGPESWGPSWDPPRKKKKKKVRVVTMTHDHDDTPSATFHAISGTHWKVSEVIDFDLRNRNSDLPVC